MNYDMSDITYYEIHTNLLSAILKRPCILVEHVQLICMPHVKLGRN